MVKMNKKQFEEKIKKEHEIFQTNIARDGQRFANRVFNILQKEINKLYKEKGWEK